MQRAGCWGHLRSRPSHQGQCLLAPVLPCYGVLGSGNVQKKEKGRNLCRNLSRSFTCLRLKPADSKEATPASIRGPRGGLQLVGHSVESSLTPALFTVSLLGRGPGAGWAGCLQLLLPSASLPAWPITGPSPSRDLQVRCLGGLGCVAICTSQGASGHMWTGFRGPCGSWDCRRALLRGPSLGSGRWAQAGQGTWAGAFLHPLLSLVPLQLLSSWLFLFNR